MIAFEPEWVAGVRAAADRLDAELARTPGPAKPDHATARASIDSARRWAERPSLEVDGRFRRTRRTWRRFGAWWSGSDVDEAWAALRNAGQALLEVESEVVVKAQIGDIAANVVSSLSPGDIRVKDYLATLKLLAPADRTITAADRAQLRAIRQACDAASDSGHADARQYRNTLTLVGLAMTVVLTALGLLAVFSSEVRSAFQPTMKSYGSAYVFEIEVLASVSGLTAAVLALRSYGGFQYTYGLPLIQAFLKGVTGAATGVLGVLLVQSDIITSLAPQTGAGVFAIAVIFGYAQHLLTRLIDQKAKDVLSSASSRNDASTTPQVPTGADTPPLLTTSAGAAPTKAPVLTIRPSTVKTVSRPPAKRAARKRATGR